MCKSVISVALIVFLVTTPIILPYLSTSSTTLSYKNLDHTPSPTDVWTYPIWPLWFHRRPLTGGLSLGVKVNRTHISRFTLGYLATSSSGVKGLITVAHAFYNDEFHNYTVYQPPIIRPSYVVNKPTFIVYYPKDDIDLAFIPYDNIRYSVFYIAECGWFCYEDRVINTIMYASQIFLENALEHPDLYEFFKTGQTTATSRAYILSFQGCHYRYEDGVVIKKCNLTVIQLEKIYEYVDLPAFKDGDSGSPVFHCLYNLCENGNDGYIAGIIVSGDRETAMAIMYNAYMIYENYGFKPWG